MVKNLFLYYKKNRWLIFALIISIACHLGLLMQFSLTVPKSDNSQVISVDIIHSRTVTVDTSPYISNTSELNAKVQISNHLHAYNEGLITNTPPLTEHRLVELTKVPSFTPKSSSFELTPTQPDNGTFTAIKDTPLASKISSDSQKSTDLIIKSTNKPSTPTYQYVELQFDIFNGHAKPIGKSSVMFMLDANGTYILNETANFQDPITNHLHAINQKSNGVISESGLIPGYYSYQDSNESKRNISASFAWVESFVNIQQPGQTSKIPLLEGTQDPLSIKYQFMFNVYSIVTPVLVGPDLKQLQFQLVAEETLETNMGDIKCLHLQTQDSNEKTDIWLGLDYQLLPIKLLRVDQAGTVIEDEVIYSIDSINRR